MATNAFIVKTALQLINALEARIHFDISPADATLLVVETEETDVNLRQMSILLETQEWPNVHVVSYKPRSATPAPAARLRGSLQRILDTRHFARELDALARTVGHAERVFIGNYINQYLVHLANRLKPESVYLLDDGLLTLTINEVRKRPRPAARFTPEPEITGYARELRLRVWRRVAGLDTTPPRRVTFFSSYRLEVGPGDSLVDNRYRYLRSQVEQLAPAGPSSAVYFLGMPWEATFSREELYVDCVRRARNHLVDGRGEGRFIYVPHRRESEETSSRIARELGVTAERYPLPIECHIILSRQLPRAVASFASTGLVNCSLLFDGLIETISFRIPREYVRAERMARVEHAYRYFEREEARIRRVDLRNDLVHS